MNIKHSLTKPFFVLVKHFVLRLFNNDILTFENERRERVIAILAMLAIAGGFIARHLLSSYLYPLLSGASVDNIWVEKAVFLTLTMALTGIFTVINRDNIFLDRKDYLNLLVLPVNLTTLFAAKFFSVLIFVGILSLAFNLFALVVYTFFLADLVGVNIFYFGFVHFLTNFLANLFVFLAVACIQAVFTLLSGNRLFQKLANLVQVMLLVGFISVFAWLPQIYGRLPHLKATFSSFMIYFPPFWFTGMYEKMVGSKEIIFDIHLYIALLALVVPAGLYFLGIPLTFKRLLISAPNGKKSSRFSSIFHVIKQGFNAVFLRNPIQRGMFYFICHTLGRSRFHKLQLTLYMGLPVSYILTGLAISYSKGSSSAFETPNGFLISIPLLLYFFLVVGIRMVVRHPFLLDANWVFKMTEDDDKKHYVRGLKKALFGFAGVPLFILMFVFYLYCWGFRLALYHSLYSWAIFLLLVEIFFATYKKIPFAGTHDPGKPNLKVYGIFYLALFIQYIVSLSALGEMLLNNPGNYLIFFVLILGLKLLLVVKRYQMYRREDFHFIYDEEEPEPLMLTLNLGN